MLILSMLLSAGCGANANSGLNIDQSVLVYFISFQEELAKRHINIPIHNLTITIDNTFTGKTSTYDAYCQEFATKAPEIHILREAWDRGNTEAREALLFHELGHCILGRDHVDSMVRDHFKGAESVYGQVECMQKTYRYRQGVYSYMPISVMHPCAAVASNIYAHLNTNDEFVKNIRSYYIDELINNRVIGYDSNF